MSWVRSPQDLGAAVVFLVIGGAGIAFKGDLEFGSAANMGPAYFPMMLSGLILLLGVVLAVRSLRIPGPPVERIAYRPLTVIVVAVLLFGFLLEWVGLAVTAVVLTLIAAYARRAVNFKEALILGVGLSIFCVLVFIVGLNQAIPLGWWPQ